VFGSCDKRGKEGKGHVQAFVYGQIPSTPEGVGKVVVRLAGGVHTTDQTLFGRLWVSSDFTNDQGPFADAAIVAPTFSGIVESLRGMGTCLYYCGLFRGKVPRGSLVLQFGPRIVREC